MRLDALQQLRLEQKLKLAPRMIQSMEILQLPLAALEERVDQEMEKNPVLELREPGNDGEAEPAAAEPEPAVAEAERELIVQDDNSNRDDFERLESMDSEFDPSEYSDYGPRRTHFDDEDPKLQALSNTAAREVSLNDHLTTQWDLVEADDLTHRCGQMIIDHLEPDGYFRTAFADLNHEVGQEVDGAVWERALRLVQTLDPPGIAARTVQECLLLQLEAMGEDHELERAIIAEHFEDLQKQQYSKIVQKTNRSLSEVKEAVEVIRTRLLLHPGLTIGSVEMPYITPDVIVNYSETGPGYDVFVPDESLPRLYISGHYRRMLQDPGVDRTTKQFVRNNIQSANWLIEAIQQRRETLRKVTTEIVNAQQEFLENGPQYLRPLPMAQVADAVGIHVATVSRAVAGKYVQAPRGIFPLRMFFSGGTETAEGESLSWDAVKAKIQEIVDHEDKTSPLSDEHIADRLKEDGIDVARRTVTKYRKLMKIPSSVRRRES